MTRHNGIIFFDAACGLCSASARRWGRVAERAGFDLVPLQDARAALALGSDADLSSGRIPSEMKLLAGDGTILDGADALAYLARFVWWAFPLHLLLTVPVMRDLARRIYRPLARHRKHISETCGLKPLM